ncbi:DUF305 domain-containing protein [Rubellimicrobium rubrum]|uniref:DUF305 domain-containing protein n=2 Tax=Rubellimicrobium rubrum TaxID=2585369 RepID=A0A5C4N711_9RHOB|nr:DUF305 domain-containing protein [Rubellimicrobium rubrum]
MRPTLLLLLTLSAGTAMGQDAAEGTGGMEHGMMMSDDPALEDLMMPMHSMMTTMPQTSTGDIDADFLLMMIPHHQSAIDMARVVLEQGDDEEVKAMAQTVIDAQEAEIAEMQAMLERLGVSGGAAGADDAAGEAASE